MGNTQTFVLQEVIDELVDVEKSLMGPLMKLSYFGRLIKNKELIDYCSAEINGYKTDGAVVPDYRRLPVALKIDLQIGYQTFPNKDLPFSMVPQPLRDLLMKTSIKEGIAAIEKTLKEENGQPSGPLIFRVAMEMVKYLQDGAMRLYKSFDHVSAVGAHLEGNSNRLVEVLSAVRERLLALVMEIGEQFGYNIEINSFKQNQEANNQIIHNYMSNITNTGDGNVVNTGDNANVNPIISIEKGNSEKLNQALRDNGIDEDDIRELYEIIKAEKSDDSSGKLGTKTNGWIGKIITKGLNGVGKISTAISANLLASMIKGYLGMHP